MKLFLPFVIVLFISGCTVANTNQPIQSLKSIQPDAETVVKKSIKKKKTILTKKTFSTLQDSHNGHIYSDLNSTIVDIADQLFSTNFNKINKVRVILTSFVDLEELDKTSTLGRLISESMFNELHVRKFEITDFRGQDAISVNNNGEFHITRDVEKLKDNIEAIEYILVGTYVKFEEDSLLINARIIDSESGTILSTARVVYKPKNCARFNLCIKKEIQKVSQKEIFKQKMVQERIEPENKTPIMIINDN